MTMETSPTLALVRLLQLASPGLPIGGYSYSQGLEWMIEHAGIRDTASVQAWIGDVLDEVITRGDAPIAWRMIQAANHDDLPALVTWNAFYRASRETFELRAETEQMGASLARLAVDLDLVAPAVLSRMEDLVPITLPAAFALATRGYAIAPAAALTAFLFAWLENQVLAAVKLVPLGQVAGQRMLAALSARIPAIAAAAMSVADDDISTFAPGVALASARHELQYSRLFRS